jgi:hypothetical protein
MLKLFLLNRYFLCRHCNQIIYACQFERPWQQAVRRAAKLRQRLGINGIVDVPEKPKGMPVATYEHLLEKTLQAEIKADNARQAQLQRLVDWVEQRT